VTAAAVPFVVLAWVGPRFLLSGEVAVLLVLAYTVHITLTAIRTCLVRAIGRPGLETRYSWLATVLNVLMTAALAVPFGVLGVVLGSAFGLAAGSVYFVVLCRRVVGVDESRLPPGWAMTTAFAVAVTVGGELLVRTNGGYGAVHLLLACLPVLAGLCIAMPLLTVSSGRSDAPEAAAAGTGSSTTTEAACRTA
jgi:O-antigen/teichoic acid export membrane protein